MAHKSDNAQVEPAPLPPVEEVAQAIVDISATMKKMNSTRLEQDGLVILLQAQCRGHVSRSQIRLVLNELSHYGQALAQAA